MPTVLKHDGFVVRIHGPPREHPPPHVHVEYGSNVVVIRLGSVGESPAVWKVHGMRDSDVFRAFRLVEQHHDLIVSAWRAIHDQKPVE